jgi:hypothetical protein
VPAASRPVALVLIACLLAGCASVPPPVLTYRPPLAARGMVLVADGAGGDPEAFDAAVTAVRQTGTPLCVRSFDWTHGRGRGVRDMTDGENARAQGRRLAQHIACYRAADSLERIVLLAPAVAADYDLRPALLTARQGVDAFTSERDRLVLGLGTRAVGTADGKRGVPPAGRVGFDAPPADACLLTRLHQHPWDPSIAWTGNRGTHAGSLNPQYFRTLVLPLLGSP